MTETSDSDSKSLSHPVAKEHTLKETVRVKQKDAVQLSTIDSQHKPNREIYSDRSETIHNGGETRT